MSLDRRTFLQIGALGAAGALLPRSALALPRADAFNFFQWKPLRGDDIRVAAGPSGNMVFIRAKDGSSGILIDTQVAPFGPQIRREVEGYAKKIVTVVNTHHHPEVTGGNWAFTLDQKVLAHVNAKPRITNQINRYISQVKEFLFREEDASREKAMEVVRKDWLDLHKRVAQLKAHEFLPTDTIESGKKEYDLGGRRVVVHVVGENAHTDNDLYIHLPDDNVLIMGGLVTGQGHALVDHEGGAHTVGWVKALTAAETWANPQTLVIPGEGNPGNSSLLTGQKQYLTTLREAVEKAVKAGRSRQEVRALRPRLRVPAGLPETRLIISLDSIFDEVAVDTAAKSGNSPPK